MFEFDGDHLDGDAEVDQDINGGNYSRSQHRTWTSFKVSDTKLSLFHRSTTVEPLSSPLFRVPLFLACLLHRHVSHVDLVLNFIGSLWGLAYGRPVRRGSSSSRAVHFAQYTPAVPNLNACWSLVLDMDFAV